MDEMKVIRAVRLLAAASELINEAQEILRDEGFCLCNPITGCSGYNHFQLLKKKTLTTVTNGLEELATIVTTDIKHKEKEDVIVTNGIEIIEWKGDSNE